MCPRFEELTTFTCSSVYTVKTTMNQNQAFKSYLNTLFQLKSCEIEARTTHSDSLCYGHARLSKPLCTCCKVPNKAALIHLFFCFFCQKVGLKISPLRLRISSLKAFPDCRSALIIFYFFNNHNLKMSAVLACKFTASRFLESSPVHVCWDTDGGPVKWPR